MIGLWGRAGTRTQLLLIASLEHFLLQVVVLKSLHFSVADMPGVCATPELPLSRLSPKGLVLAVTAGALPLICLSEMC